VRQRSMSHLCSFWEDDKRGKEESVSFAWERSWSIEKKAWTRRQGYNLYFRILENLANKLVGRINQRKDKKEEKEKERGEKIKETSKNFISFPKRIKIFIL
jgi:hypothetical protein